MNPRFLGALIGVSTLFDSSLHAAPLPEGRWLGLVTMYQQQELEAQFKVKQADENQYAITMFYDDRPYSFDHLNVSDDELNFVLDTGSKYGCKLLRQTNNILSGKCKLEMEHETRTILLTIAPPEALEPENMDTEENPEHNNE